MKEPLVSFIILDIKNHYLAPLTIESILNQRKKNYEIIVLTRDILPQDFENLRDFSEFIHLIKPTKNKNYAKVMNEAIKYANGKYLNFLFPGEVCLSKYSLERAVKVIEERNYPDLLCFSFLQRDIDAPPEVRDVSFSISLIRGERFPLYAKDCLFSKKKVKNLKGFSDRYSYIPSFDMVSRIFLKKGKIFCIKEVFADYELQKSSPKAMVGYLFELISIIYKNYGFLNFMHLYVLREIFYLFIWCARGIKRHFVQAD